MPSNKEIIDYYIFSKLDYRLYNGRLANLSMHYGLWDKTTSNHRDALANENRLVAEAVHVSPTDSVIDLGCGYGSSAVWLATNIGCRVTGITLSEEQVADAQRLAARRGVADRVNFEVMDFHYTDFPDETFDVAISIESVCHSAQKDIVLGEAWRILKPGGRLVIADAYFAKKRESLTSYERAVAKQCFEGVHIPPLPTKDEFEDYLTAANFSGIRWQDKTESILPTAIRVNRLGRVLLPISRVLGWFNIRQMRASHMQAFVSQYEAFRGRIGVYGIFTANKPVAVSPRRRQGAKQPRERTVLLSG